MAVKIQWQPPLVLEERKKAQWERIIRFELGEVEDPPDVSLRFDAESLRWRVDTSPHAPAGMPKAAVSRERVVDALRAHGKPVV
jgi:hypothetical protein